MSARCVARAERVGYTRGPMGRRVAASDAVRREWERRVVAEYRSAAITQHVTLWMIQLAVSPDLVLDGLRIVKDELAHADLSHRTLVAAGGAMTAPIARETLGLSHDEREPLEIAVTRVCVDTFCLGETLAVPLFKGLREACEVPVARRALDRILRDEVRHRDFGWNLLSHLLELPDSVGVRSLVQRDLPRLFAKLRRTYGAGSSGGAGRVLSPIDAMPAADRRWGLMPAADYAAALERAFGRDWLPRFSARGIDPTPAWERALTMT